LTMVFLENVQIEPGDVFETKFDAPRIIQLVLKFSVPEYEKRLKSVYLNDGLKKLIHPLTQNGDLESLNPFVKPLHDILTLEINFNGLVMLRTSETELTAAFLSQGMTDAMVNKLTPRTRIFRVFGCGNVTVSRVS